ncbi:hypothetical protein DL96DRAFT_1701949 [Flagelloscypha sp. PMI_526]|nr:hypothetical protein DL96DRAFT_1701949 [Flagelloscypha sp. PMI_526]
MVTFIYDPTSYRQQFGPMPSHYPSYHSGSSRIERLRAELAQAEQEVALARQQRFEEILEEERIRALVRRQIEEEAEEARLQEAISHQKELQTRLIAQRRLVQEQRQGALASMLLEKGKPFPQRGTAKDPLGGGEHLEARRSNCFTGRPCDNVQTSQYSCLCHPSLLPPNSKAVTEQLLKIKKNNQPEIHPSLKQQTRPQRPHNPPTIVFQLSSAPQDISSSSNNPLLRKPITSHKENQPSTSTPIQDEDVAPIHVLPPEVASADDADWDALPVPPPRSSSMPQKIDDASDPTSETIFTPTNAQRSEQQRHSDISLDSH